ncbi:hypothetical protein [Nonomuraea aridisoli]|nr:hypothetical protein [Nonomuraea aridisoli]
MVPTKPLRPLLICALLTLPALSARVAGVHPPPAPDAQPRRAVPPPGH